MSNMTRRTLLRDGSLAASAATLLPAGMPKPAEAEDAASNVFHVFAFRWKPGTSEAQIDRATREIRAFQGLIPDFSKPTWDKISLQGERLYLWRDHAVHQQGRAGRLCATPGAPGAAQLAGPADRSDRVGYLRLSAGLARAPAG